ncbi:MAG: acetyl-CoA carboxylase biotin carboxyl carrier protein [bacterium]
MTFDEIIALIDRIDKSSLSELRVSDGDYSITLRRSVAGTPHHGAVPSATGSGAVAGTAAAGDSAHARGVAGGAPGTQAGEGPTAEASTEGELEEITSPIVGTVYRSPAPDSPPFVEEGSEVKEGQTLCIIEAMKVMNELEADFDLRVEGVLVDNGEMVEYGTPILQVRRL